MNENDVIKALECCTKKYGCCDCPLENDELCMITINKEALSLIKRQQATIEQEVDLNREMFEKMARDEAEIEQWKEEANRYQNLWCDAEKDISNARIEAQKDFAERLKEHMCSYDFSNYHYFKAVDEDTLDEVLKEMTEGKDDEQVD